MLAVPVWQGKPVFAASAVIPIIPADPATQRPDTNRQNVIPPINFEQTYDTGKIILRPEYGSDSGFVLGAVLARKFSDNSAGGLLLSAGSQKQEIVTNLGLGIGDNHRVLATFGLLRQKLDFSFVSGSEKEFINQYAGVLGYQYALSNGFFNALEFSGYATKTPGRELEGKQYSTDSAARYELWSDNRRIAGSRIAGYQAQLVMEPNVGGSIKLGAEQLRYDLLTGEEKTTRATGNAEWSQFFHNGFGLKLAANTAAAQNRYSVDLSQNLRDDQRLSFGYAYIQDRDGNRNDQRINLGYSWLFGASDKARTSSLNNVSEPAKETANRPQRSAHGWTGSLINLVATRPSVLPAQVVAKLDSTATPTRLVAIVKTSLPTGSSVNTATTQITVPLGIAVTGIASVARNSAAFANAGQFGLSGNNLIVDSKNLQQPAVGVTDTYVVSVSTAAGGTILATVKVSHGSVQIDSITLTQLADAVVPVAAADSVSTAYNTAKTGIDVLANDTDNSGVAPALIGVLSNQVGGTFTVNAGKIDFTPTAGFTGNASVTYQIRDGANNLATGVLTVSVGADATVPVAVADSATTAYNTVKTGIDVLANDTDNSGIAPTLTGVLTNPVGGTFTVNAGKIDFTPTAGFSGNASVTYEIKDATGNKATGSLTITVAAADTIPDAFTFADQTNIVLSTLTESAAITIAGINAASAISVTGGEYQINGGAWTSIAGTVSNGQTVKVRHTSSASFSAATNTVLSIGGVSDTFTSTTVAFVADTTPDAFSLVDQTNIAPGTLAESTAITVAGINTASPVSVTGGEYSINGGTWTSIAGTVSNGQTVKVRHTSSGSFGAATNTVLNIGGVSDTFTSTTVAAPVVVVDTTPDAFSLVDQSGIAPGTLTESAAITVAGINTASPISVTGGEYSINNGAWTTAAGTVGNGQTVKVRHTSSASFSAATNTVLSIGGVVDTFTSTTVAAPVVVVNTTPDAFSLVDQSGIAPGTLTESAAITVAGINAASAISVTGGEYQINGGAWTSIAGTVSNGQTVKVRHTSSGSFGAATNTVLSIGGVSDTFTSTTVAAPAEVPPVMGNVPDQNGTVNTAFSLNLAAYVTQTNGDAIQSYAMASGALPTGLSLDTATGVISGTPNAAGSFAITVTASDNDGASNADAITFTIAAANTAPTASDFTLAITVTAAVNGNWLALSSAADANSDPLSASVKTQGTKGTFAVAGNTLTYTPAANKTGADSGVITVADGKGGSKDVTVTVSGIDSITAPTATPTASLKTDTGESGSDNYTNSLVLTGFGTLPEGATGYRIGVNGNAFSVVGNISEYDVSANGNLDMSGSTSNRIVIFYENSKGCGPAQTLYIRFDNRVPIYSSKSVALVANNTVTGQTITVKNIGGAYENLSSATIRILSSGGTPIAGASATVTGVSGAVITFDATLPNTVIAGDLLKLEVTATDKAGNVNTFTTNTIAN